MSDLYILKDGEPVECDDPKEWGLRLGDRDRHVARTVKGSVKVSTVFLGIDHNFGIGPPILFETMIFGGEHDQEMDRYPTRGEAVIGHNKMCRLAFDGVHV